MRAGRLILAGAAVLVAGLLLLLAADVLRWQDAFGDDDAALAAGRTPSWQADTRIPGGVARRALAVDDDRALRRAIVGYRGASGKGDSLEPSTQRRKRAEAEVALADVAAAGSPAQASQASNLLGILLFADATTNGALGRSTPVEQSVGAFENAVTAAAQQRGGEVQPGAHPAAARGARRARGRDAVVRPARERPARRRRRHAGARVLMPLAALTFLTPAAGLVALAVVLPLGALLLADRRLDAARRLLRLPPPGAAGRAGTIAALVAVPLLLGLAAAAAGRPPRSGPAGAHGRGGDVRRRHLALDGRRRPPGRERTGWRVPRAAAIRLRSELPEVPSGLATLTDRALPSLFPVGDQATFDSAARALVLEQPPPQGSSLDGDDVRAARRPRPRRATSARA